MKSIQNFNDFVNEELVAVGYGPNTVSQYSIGSGYPMTGYNMTPISFKVGDLGSAVATEALLYQDDTDPNHTAENYLKEAKKYINDKLNEIYESSCGKTNENRDPKSIHKEYDNLKKMSKSDLERMWKYANKIGTPSGLDKEGLISDILRGKHGDSYVDAAFESLNEADEYEYDPQEHAKRLEKKKETNLRRYRAAQDRGDNYAIKYYELRMRLDDIESEKLKTKVAIEQLKKKFGKDE